MDAALSFQLIMTLVIVGSAIVLYVTEWLSMELTSLIVMAVLLFFFHFFPVGIYLTPEALLGGFSNTALITVLALLVCGEGLAITGGLNGIVHLVCHPRIPAMLSLMIIMVLVAFLSAFLNNTPIVVVFIPVLQGVAQRAGFLPGQVMMPLSFVAILGGMTTLIGSSTNLMVSSALIEMGEDPLDFFTVTPMAVPLAILGMTYAMFVLPRLLPDRSSMTQSLTGGGKQYISQIRLREDSELIGETAIAGFLKSLPDVTLRMILRGNETHLAPFEDITLQKDDTLIVALTRKTLTEVISRYPKLFDSALLLPKREDEEEKKDDVRKNERLLVEMMVAPSSRMIGMNLERIALRQRFSAIVLGIQRRARMLQRRMTSLPLEPGDVLLVQGTPDVFDKLRAERDLVILSGTTTELPKSSRAMRSLLIFGFVVIPPALGLLPILMTSLTGAALMIGTGILNLRQATRAIDRRIILLVAAALAMGDALYYTGAAAYIADFLLQFVSSDTGSVKLVLAAFFLLVALFTNLLSNNACAVLFTPIGVNLAQRLEVDPMMFVITVVLAANCSFASPMGYKTNLLVMGPGHYQFSDFIKAGLPLLFLLWGAYIFLASFVWGV